MADSCPSLQARRLGRLFDAVVLLRYVRRFSRELSSASGGLRGGKTWDYFAGFSVGFALVVLYLVLVRGWLLCCFIY